jgi:hypothetical protein
LERFLKRDLHTSRADKRSNSVFRDSWGAAADLGEAATKKARGERAFAE